MYRGAKVQFDLTGWAEYQDTQYTSGAPLTLTADTDTTLPNNAGTVRQTEKPRDISTFYNQSTLLILGRYGDGLNIFVYFKSAASTAAGTYIDLWLQIQSDPVIDLYRRTITYPKGNATETGVSMSIAGFTYDLWDQYGALLKVRSNADGVTVWDIRYVLTRTHKAQTALA
jgi:hypothetical protein